MSKGRTNKGNALMKEKEKEVELLRKLNVKEKEADLLRELNNNLINMMEGMKTQMTLLKKEKSDLQGCIHEKDRRIGEIENVKANLERDLHHSGCKYGELEAKTSRGERAMMYKMCDMDKRYKDSLILQAKMASNFHQEKLALQEETKRMKENEQEDRRAWKERVGTLEKALRKSEEGREIAEKNCLQPKVNGQNMDKEGNRQESNQELEQCRKAIAALFHALRSSRCELEARNHERKVMEERIRLLEGDLSASEKKNMDTRIKFENLKESGAWTGVLLQRQDDRIKHLAESLQEERVRVKAANSKMERFMDELDAERKEKCVLIADLYKSQEEAKALAQGMMSIKEELGNKDLEEQELRFKVESLKQELEALKYSMASSELRLSEAEKESGVLRARNAELNAQNQLARQDFCNLHRDTKGRFLQLKKSFAMIKCSHP